jgi:phage terminase small subunit
MPINDKQRAFINEYMINGHNATKAYKKAYPDCKSGHKQNGSRLLTNDDILKTIAGLMAITGAEVGWSVAKAQAMLIETRDRAILQGTSSVEVSAVVAINRMFGLDKDASLDKQEPEDISDTELMRLQALSKDMTGPKLKHNTA